MTKLTVVTIQPGALFGTVEEVDWGLNWLQTFVGGGIEHITLVRRTLGLYMNDEAKFQEPRWLVNGLATTLYRHSFGFTDANAPAGSTIEGPVVLVGGPDEEGDDLSIPATMLAVLREQGVIK